MLQIIVAHLKHYALPQLPQEQAGFTRDGGTGEQMLNLRQIVEKASVLEEMGVPHNLILVIKRP